MLTRYALGGGALLATAGAACLLMLPCGGPDAGPVIERQANVFTYNRQQSASVDVDAGGNALVVWGSRRQEGGTYGVFGRLFAPDGSAVGGEIHVNQHMPNAQETPAVAFAPDGTAWVTWHSYGQDGDGGAIVARRFGRVDDRFTALGDEIVVNTTIEGDQNQPAVAASGDRALVVWTSAGAGPQRVLGRLLDADGTPLTDEIDLGAGVGHEWLPAVAARPDGRFVVAWSRRAVDGPPAGLFARLVGADGAPSADVVTVASAAGRHDVEPAIDADATGRFVVAWMGTSPAGGYDVYARRFAADGTALGAETLVAAVADRPAGSWMSGAAVAMAADGRFAVSCNVEEATADDGTTNAMIVAHRFEADGTPNGPPFVANVADEGAQALAVSNARRVAWGADDRLVFAWHGATGDDGSGIGVSLHLAAPAAAAPATLVLDEAIVADSADGDQIGERVPPEFDPNWVPEKPETIVLAPGSDFGFIGFTSTGWNPPDPDIAVGPNHIVVAVNGGIKFYTKDGTQTFSRPLTGSGGFWGEVGGGSFIFDPVELFDPHSQRFIVATTEHLGSNRSYLDLAVSDDDDPNGTWYKYRWNLITVGGFIDFPNLGVGPDAIYICTDFFSSPQGNHIHIIDKAATLVGDATFPTSVRTSSGFLSLGAVKNYDTDAPAQYFATTNSGSNRIQFHAIRDPLGTPLRDVFNLSVAAFSDPPGAQQLGSSNRVATVGRRTKNGVYRNGRLWLTHTIGPGVARMRWYEIDMNGWPGAGAGAPTVVQWGTQDLGTSVHNWFGDVDVDASGNAAFAFNRSSPSEYVSIQRTFRMADDPTGTLREPVTMQTSTSPELGSRWGDYGGVHQDPADPIAFWSMHEYRTSSWRTWVGRWEIDAVACVGDTNGDGVVDTADLINLLAVWGACGGCPEDLNDDGVVDTADLIMLLAAWGSCP